MYYRHKQIDFVNEFVQDHRNPDRIHSPFEKFEQCWLNSGSEEFPEETGELSWWEKVKSCKAVKKFLSDQAKKDFLIELMKP